MGKVASEASRIGQWRYEKERERSSQVRRLREHSIHRYAVPLPRVGKVASGASRIGFWRYERERGDLLKCVVYESTLSTAGAVPLPQWGRQRGGGFAAQKEANPASLRSAAPSKGRGSRGHSLLPMEGGAPKGRRLDGESAIPDTKPSPRGEGGERSEPDRVLAV